MDRRILPWVVLLAATLHAVGMARSPLPAQDGLKFIRIARQFQSQPWADVVRGSDQHPLYPALVAAAQPIVALAAGHGPDSWRIAAQAVSALASILLLFPLFHLTRALFDERTAAFAVLCYVLLPFPAEIGHETLADALALLMATLALCLGEVALRTCRLAPAVGCAVASGAGYLTRPEVAIVPMAVVLTGGMLMLVGMRRRLGAPGVSHRVPSIGPGRLASLSVVFLAMVGSYAMVKGEVSEKLALRRAAALPSRHDAPRKVRHAMPRGLDDPRWDFSPKEESGSPRHLSLAGATGRLVAGWAEGLGWVLAPMALWGALRLRRDGMNDPGGWGRPGYALIGVYLALYSIILIRHAMSLGYLSGRHTLSMVVAVLPFAAAGVLAWVRRLATTRSDATGLSFGVTPHPGPPPQGGRETKNSLSPRGGGLGWGGDGRGDPVRWLRRVGRAALLLLAAVGIAAQVKDGHPSRWGHQAAGRWLAEQAGPADAVLDTRGWAAFVSGRRAYDYWHVRQALTDARLAYLVVGSDELAATSRRAATLRALLAYAAEPVAMFPERRGGDGVGVQVYRFHRPESWEGLRP